MRASEMVIGLAAVMLAGLASTGFAQQIILSTDRHSYLLHEPVELRIDYINRAEKPWASELEPVSLSVLEPGGLPRSVGLWQNRLDDVIDRSPLRKLVGPGQTYRRVVWVALDKNGDWIFPSAGRWQLGVQGLPAAQIEIKIVEPAVGDSKDAAALFDTGVCRTFLSDGNDVGDAVPVLQEIVEKYPRTTFAFFAAWTLVQDKWVHRYEKGMDWEKERAWLSLILQAPQDHPLRPAAMYAMVRHHNFQHGHKDQAKKAAEDLAEAYPWNTWAHDVKSEFGHDVSAKLAPFSDDPALKSRREVPGSAPAAQPGDNQPASGTPLRIDIPQLDAREFAKASRVHLENQRKVVDLSISLISSKEADLSNRHLAVILLGQLRAVEGAPALAAHVDDNLALRSAEITVSNSYRCVQALIDIGIPGALASMNQIEADAKSEAPKEGDLRLWNDRLESRRNLLALVVLKVYGERLAKIVLEDRIAQTEGPKVKEAYQKALESFPRIRNWLPEEKVATTSPTAANPAK